MEICLIRHGETKSNSEKRYLGCRTDEGLSEVGIEKLSEVNADQFDFIFSGKMKRCLETAQILFPEREIEILQDIYEMDFGIFEGKNYMELSGDEKYQGWIDSFCEDKIPDGESKTEFIDRTVVAFQEFLKKLPETTKKVAVVLHGGNIMAVMSHFTKGNYYDFQVKNGEGYVLKMENLEYKEWK